MTMFDVKSVAVEIGGDEISFETGKLARQASGAVVVRSGETMVLCTATMGNLRDVDFLPLTVDVEERHYAVGKIPGSYFRREARAGEKATLTARMIDRPLRPLFPKGWHYETQLVSTPLSVDHVHPYDILAMNGASAALAISPVPVAAARRRGPRRQARWRLRRQPARGAAREPRDGPDRLRLQGRDPDGRMRCRQRHRGRGPRCTRHRSRRDQEARRRDGGAAAEGRQGEGHGRRADDRRGAARPDLAASHQTAIDEATSVPEKLARQEAVEAIKDAVLAQYAPDTGDEEADAARHSEISAAFDAIEKSTIRKRIAVDKKRPDGRAQDEIRPIETEVDISPRVHGSALFTRGETQILSNVALGTTRMDMRLDNLGLQETKTFFHHYNFPPYSVGEAGFMRGPKRRDIGHGALAERALVPTIPSVEDFPYVTRVVSETLESNGSSSMGSVCASSMALQAAGVPVSSPVAGVAMGLIKEDEHVIVLTDIAGVEDHLGDMDFKVAGTEEGINALQMDIKITGVTFDILREALEQARQGRLFILGKMAEAIEGPRDQLSPTAPRIESIKIDPEKIGAVIGKGGETIRGLSEEFEAQIDVEDDGTIRVYAANGELVEACIAQISAMTREAEVGDTFKGKVVKTTTFGAFVELVKGTDGLLHISAVKPGERVETVEDVLNAGDELDVTVVEVDRERGRIGLRRSDDPQVAGKSKEELAAVGSGDRGPRGGGGGDRGGRGGRDRGGRGGDRGGRGGERRRRD